jgi:hypothetical protein
MLGTFVLVVAVIAATILAAAFMSWALDMPIDKTIAVAVISLSIWGAAQINLSPQHRR